MFPRSPRTPAPARVALVRTLEALECRVTPSGVTHTTTTSTLVTEVVTNTPVTVETVSTRILGPFVRVIPTAYDPTNPDIVAAIADARAALGGVSNTTVVLGSSIRHRTAFSSAPVETGRTDIPTGTEQIDTVGPATIRVGDDQTQTYFVPAGTVNTNTLTRARRDIATATSETYATTQDVFVEVGDRGTSGTSFTASSQTIVLVAPSAAQPANDAAVTRIVGTLNGVRFDTTVNAPYDPANPDIQAAISNARQAVATAGAKTEDVIIGVPLRFRTATAHSTTTTSVFTPATKTTTTIGPSGHPFDHTLRHWNRLW